MTTTEFLEKPYTNSILVSQRHPYYISLQTDVILSLSFLQILHLEESLSQLKVIHVAGAKGKVIFFIISCFHSSDAKKKNITIHLGLHSNLVYLSLQQRPCFRYFYLVQYNAFNTCYTWYVYSRPNLITEDFIAVVQESCIAQAPLYVVVFLSFSLPKPSQHSKLHLTYKSLIMSATIQGTQKGYPLSLQQLLLSLEFGSPSAQGDYHEGQDCYICP